MSTKEQVIKDVTSIVNDLFKVIDGKSLELARIEKEIAIAAEDYKNIVDGAKKEKSLMAERTSEVEKKEAALVMREEQLKRDTEKLQSKMNDLMSEREYHLQKLEAIEESKKEATAQYEIVKGALQREEAAARLVDSLIDKANKKSVELNEIKEEYDRKKSQAQTIVDDAKVLADRMITGLKEREASLIKRADELNDLDKRLKDKEANLLVIESRWKKLYAEKGASFKV